MQLTNELGWPAAWTMGFRPDGREVLVVIVKATWRLPRDGAVPTLADDVVPLVEADRFTGEPGLSAPSHETDFAHDKPACDVLLVGSAHAGAGRQARQVEVGLQLGTCAKRFRVLGPRRWQRRLGGWSAEAPASFTVLPIHYGVAFGGSTTPYDRNPVGRGYAPEGEGLDGQWMPSTEAIDQPVTTPDGDYAPQALGPVGRNWWPRRQLAGTYDQAWIETTAPLWPADFDPRYFQSAPPDQQVPHPVGGEPVVLRHLTPGGHLAFALPRRRVPVVFIPHRGRDVQHEARIDTVVFEPDAGHFTMTWRATLPLARSIFDVRETVLGERTQAWHRAMHGTPPKIYHRGLGAAVRAHAARRRA